MAASCQQEAPRNLDWQGHRGARGLAPENTIPGFIKALEYPEITTLELDLAVSSDGHLVVSHEPWFSHEFTTMPDGQPLSADEAEAHLLYRMTLKDIQRFDVGLRANARFPGQAALPACKPSLKAVVDSVRAAYPDRFSAIKWNAEIKSRPEWDGERTPPVADFAAMVVQFVQDNGLRQRMTVQSFDVRALQAVRRLDPTIRLALLIEHEGPLEDNLELLGFNPDVYSPNYNLVTSWLVEQCHEKGMQVIPWTINESDAMEMYTGLGVDGIITDYPDRIPKRKKQ